jgi:hypothetical protein
MWQFQWMLSLLPDWVWSTLFFSSIAGLLASVILTRIPFISTYKSIVQLISVAGLALSIWFLGAASTNAVWEAKIKDLEEKVRVAEEQSNNKNVIIKFYRIDPWRERMHFQLQSFSKKVVDFQLPKF